jgi:hypothetical protein
MAYLRTLLDRRRVQLFYRLSSKSVKSPSELQAAELLPFVPRSPSKDSPIPLCAGLECGSAQEHLLRKHHHCEMGPSHRLGQYLRSGIPPSSAPLAAQAHRLRCWVLGDNAAPQVQAPHYADRCWTQLRRNCVHDASYVFRSMKTTWIAESTSFASPWAETRYLQCLESPCSEVFLRVILDAIEKSSKTRVHEFLSSSEGHDADVMISAKGFGTFAGPIRVCK